MKTRMVVPIIAILSGLFAVSCEEKVTNPGIKPTTEVVMPAESGTEVPRNFKVAFTFNKDMDASTINNSTFRLMGTSLIPGTVSYYDKTATFTPSVMLAANANYTATISDDVRDMDGNPLASDTEWNFRTGGNTAPVAAINWGSAAGFAVFAETAIKSTGTTTITGDMGVSRRFISDITGFDLTITDTEATSAQVNGIVSSSEMAEPAPDKLSTAETNMLIAYNDAASRRSADFEEFGDGNIGDKTLSAGVYRWAHGVTMPRDIIISGSANDVWIFQIAGDLNTGSTVRVTLSGGAQAKNIFWQVSGQTTIGANSHFEGNIISLKNITLQQNVSLNGRLLTSASVMLNNNTITVPQ